MGRGIPWTADQETRLLRMRANGATVNACCDVLGFNRLSVIGKLKALGLSQSRVAKSSTDRRCLVCRTTFPSEGVHDRVCPNCEKTDAWRFGMTGVPA